MAVLPGIVCMALFALCYLGLMIPGTFLHVDENHSGKDRFYDVINWLIFCVAALMALFPHVYTVDYYSAKSWRKYKFGSWHILAGLANTLYTLMLAAALCVMIVVCVLTGIDKRVVPVILYSIFTFILACATLYFALEWRWCASAFLKVYRSKRRDGQPVTIVRTVEILERQAEDSERMDTTVVLDYGRPRRNNLPM